MWLQRLLVLCLLSVPALASELKVVCTIPDLADIARRIGGERVDALAIAKGREDVHAVRIKPSHIVAVSRADLFVQIGLSLEHAWVPGLLEVARNRSVQPGGPGFVNVSEGWNAIGIPEDLSREQGVDIHPEGNPHLNLSPFGGRHMAQAIHAALVRADPGGREHYDARYAAYTKELAQAQERWQRLAGAFAGRKVVLYHRDLDYFLAAYDMKLCGTIEPKPGMPPTPGHVLGLIERMRELDCRLVVVAPWSNNGQAKRIAEQAQASLVEVPQMVDAYEQADTWIAMMEIIHQRLLAAATGRAE